MTMIPCRRITHGLWSAVLSIPLLTFSACRSDSGNDSAATLASTAAAPQASTLPYPEEPFWVHVGNDQFVLLNEYFRNRTGSDDKLERTLCDSGLAPAIHAAAVAYKGGSLGIGIGSVATNRDVVDFVFGHTGMELHGQAHIARRQDGPRHLCIVDLRVTSPNLVDASIRAAVEVTNEGHGQ